MTDSQRPAGFPSAGRRGIHRPALPGVPENGFRKGSGARGKGGASSGSCGGAPRMLSSMRLSSERAEAEGLRRLFSHEAKVPRRTPHSTEASVWFSFSSCLACLIRDGRSWSMAGFGVWGSGFKAETRSGIRTVSKGNQREIRRSSLTGTIAPVKKSAQIFLTAFQYVRETCGA